MYFFLLLTFILTQPEKDIEINNTWIRPGAKGMNTALYFDVKNNNDNPDTLYKAESNISKVVELHETYKTGEMMGMRETEFVIISAHSTFSFKPGGYHIMLIDLNEKLTMGDSSEVILHFKKAGALKIKTPVKK